jgi:hypothetical protein
MTDQITYEAKINGTWQEVSASKLLFLLLPMGIVQAYRMKDDSGIIQAYRVPKKRNS